MSASESCLPCPICSHIGVFNTVQSLRDRLIYVSTNTLTCPVCQEELTGLDKLTIHLFSHVKLLVVETKKQGSNSKSKKRNKSLINHSEPLQKKSINSTKNNPQPLAGNSPVKYVKICPKPPKLALTNVPIISPPEENDFENIRQISDKTISPELATKAPILSPSVCDICGLEFTDLNIFEMHKNLVHNYVEEKSLKEAKFRCHVCPKIFKMRGSLMVHLRVAHFGFLSCDRKSSKINEIKSNGSSEMEGLNEKIASYDKCDNKQWQCDVCRKYFTTKYFLKKHKRLHTGETPYACAQCNKTFTFQQSYHKHLLYHNDEKPHICSYCGRAFKELSTLHNHQRIHTGEKPFSCETCGKCFRQRVSYLVHRRIHTGVMPYKCTACNKSFRYKVSQRTHKCLAQPPGTVVRQSGELVEKLKKKQSTPYQDSQKELEPFKNNITIANNTIQHTEVPETNAKYVGKLEKKQSIPEYSYQDLRKVLDSCKNDVKFANNTIQISEMSEGNAELIRSGAKLSLEDMDSEYFKLIPESTYDSTHDKFENSPTSNSNINNFSICDDLFTENISNLIDCIQDEDKNAPSPSEILQNLCL